MADPEMSRTITNLRLLAHHAGRAVAADADAAAAATAADAAAADDTTRREIQRLQRRVAELESQYDTPHGRDGFPYCGGRYSGEWEGVYHGKEQDRKTYRMRPHGRGRLEFWGRGIKNEYVQHAEDGQFVHGHFRRGFLEYRDETREPFPFPQQRGWTRRHVLGQGHDTGPWDVSAVQQAGWVVVRCKYHHGFCLVVTPSKKTYCTHKGWASWDWCYRGRMGHYFCAKQPELCFDLTPRVV